jgi:peptidoglycan/LPS O-acetylase OafA/YrhL
MIAFLSALLLVLFAPNLKVGVRADEVHLGLLRILFSYSVGILIWRIRGQKPWLSAWVGQVLLLVGSLLGAACLPSDASWPDFVFAFVLSPLIVICGLAPLKIGKRWLSYFGSISFPLYAVHSPLVIMTTDAGFGFYAALAVALCGATVVTYFSMPGWRARSAFRPSPARQGA